MSLRIQRTLNYLVRVIRTGETLENVRKYVEISKIHISAILKDQEPIFHKNEVFDIYFVCAKNRICAINSFCAIAKNMLAPSFVIRGLKRKIVRL